MMGYDKDRFVKALTTLTDQERAVLDLFIEGWSNKEIAMKIQPASDKKVEVSEKTIRYHLTQIYRKLSVDGETSHKGRQLMSMYFKAIFNL